MLIKLVFLVVRTLTRPIRRIFVYLALKMHSVSKKVCFGLMKDIEGLISIPII